MTGYSYHSLTDDEKAALEAIPLEDVPAAIKQKRTDEAEVLRQYNAADEAWRALIKQLKHANDEIAHLKARLELEL